MEIIEDSLDLIQTCIDCQFAKVRDKQFKDDFTSDLIIILNEYDNTRLNTIYEEGKMNCFVTGIITRNINSVNSPYYRDYYRFQNRTDEITEEDTNIPDHD